MTMKCLGVSLKRALVGFPRSDADEEGRLSSGLLSAVEDVRSSVTKSLGVVGPGNCADK